MLAQALLEATGSHRTPETRHWAGGQTLDVPGGRDSTAGVSPPLPPRKLLPCLQRPP